MTADVFLRMFPGSEDVYACASPAAGNAARRRDRLSTFAVYTSVDNLRNSLAQWPAEPRGAPANIVSPLNSLYETDY